MGGSGSGSWSRWGTRSTAESYKAIDVNLLHRSGYLRSGRRFFLSWTRGGKPSGSIGGWAEEGWIILDYQLTEGDGEPRDVRYSVGLTWTPCNYGGFRPWFKCPGCYRRVGKLYGGARFLCRHCYGLAYNSQNESACDRVLSKCQNLRRRLGGTANMTEPFPDKPKGMHWRTYWRLWEQYMRSERDEVSLMARRFGLPGF